MCKIPMTKFANAYMPIFVILHTICIKIHGWEMFCWCMIFFPEIADVWIAMRHAWNKTYFHISPNAERKHCSTYSLPCRPNWSGQRTGEEWNKCQRSVSGKWHMQLSVSQQTLEFKNLLAWFMEIQSFQILCSNKLQNSMIKSLFYKIL